MGVLDFLNGLGQKFEKYALKEEFKAAGAVKNATNQNPILRKFNSLVDEYRGLIFLLMFIWMLAMAYFIIYYDNGLLLRTRAFIGADDACVLGHGDSNGYILSGNLVGYCQNLSGVHQQQMVQPSNNGLLQCLNASLLNYSCKCNSTNSTEH